MKVKDIALDGLFRQNPTLKLVLGTCPTLALTTVAMNGVGMGLAVTFVLMCSNMIISLLRNIIPSKVRIPAYILIIATFVTIIRMLLYRFLPTIADSLGTYLPLIVVNCIILGRAEAYASKNSVITSIFDGIGMGLGFTLGLTLIGIVREFLGAGTVFSLKVMPASYEPLTIFILAPGAFFVLAVLTAIMNGIKQRSGKGPVRDISCDPSFCAGCSNKGCMGRSER